jgi:ABC-type uncharacterized transport system auxiliary subunit
MAKLRASTEWRVRTVVAVAACLSGVACNRAAMRIPGASLSFPQTSTGYVASKTYPFSVVVAMPTDLRPEHYDEQVAGTRWAGCRTDPFWASDAPSVIRDRMVAELAHSKLFTNVSQGAPAAGDLVVRSDVDAFCSQAVGFLFLRVAGISAIKITIERDGRPLFEHKFERVVTDADPQYTGSQVTFIEQAMQVTMADSLRELMRDVLTEIERNAGGWS